MKKRVFRGGFGFGKLEFGEAGVDEVLQKRTVQMTLVNFKALPFKLRTVVRGWSCTRGPSSPPSSSCSIVQLQAASVSGAAEAADMRTADTSRFEESQGCGMCKMNEEALNGVEGAADREAED